MIRRSAIAAILIALSSPALATDARVVELIAIRQLSIHGKDVVLPITRHADGRVCFAFLRQTTLFASEPAKSEPREPEFRIARVCGFPASTSSSADNTASPSPATELTGWPWQPPVSGPNIMLADLLAIRPVNIDGETLAEIPKIAHYSSSQTYIVSEGYTEIEGVTKDRIHSSAKHRK